MRFKFSPQSTKVMQSTFSSPTSSPRTPGAGRRLSSLIATPRRAGIAAAELAVLPLLPSWEKVAEGRAPTGARVGTWMCRRTAEQGLCSRMRGRSDWRRGPSHQPLSHEGRGARCDASLSRHRGPPTLRRDTLPWRRKSRQTSIHRNKDQTHHALELRDEPARRRWRGFCLVERRRLDQIPLRAWMKRDAHPGNRARSRAIASSNGTATA